MPCCRYCGVKTDEDLVFCPNCWEVLTEEDTVWQEVQIQVNVDEAKHRANMYTISGVVLVSLGIVAGWVLCVSSSALGLFGIVLVCLGIGCTASADRHEHKARNLKERLWR
jgi:uncharacterized membrane protein HdeD (DUF308 family)